MVTAGSSFFTLSDRPPLGQRGPEAGPIVVWLWGEHDASTDRALCLTLARAIALDRAGLVLDLSEVESMGTSTLGVILRARRFLRQRSASLTVRAPSAAAKSVIDDCGLSDLLCPGPEVVASVGEETALSSWVAVPLIERPEAQPGTSEPVLERVAARVGPTMGVGPDPTAPPTEAPRRTTANLRLADGEPTPALRPSGRNRCTLDGEDVPRWRGVLHALALVVALPAVTVLIWRHGLGGGLLVYAAGLVGLYAVSSSYHLAAWSPAGRRRMSRADHEMIFVFIAATATPYCLLGVPGEFSDIVLGSFWLGACLGAFAVQIRFEKSRGIISAAYLFLGWLALFTFPEAVQRLDFVQLSLLGAMGGLYTAGTVVQARRWPNPSPRVFGYHEVWHAMVVLASACGFALIWSFGA